MKKKVWTAPAGEYYNIIQDMLEQPHLLVAGSTGSGKSVLINTLIHTLLLKSPNSINLCLIDPKRVELVGYKGLPHTVHYASEPAEILLALRVAVGVMERRYEAMQTARQRKSTACHIYIIIDEYADLITTQKKQVEPLIMRLAQLGRAANMHLIIATQRPTRDVITGQVKVNIDARVALRCPTAQDSRNIINVKGAEALPRYGYGYYLTPNGLELIAIPLTPEEEITARVAHWEDQARAMLPWYKRILSRS